MAFTLYSGRWQERPLVSESFHIFVLRTYDVHQFHHHRGDQDHANIWTCITRYVLL